MTPEYDEKQKDGAVFSNHRSSPRLTVHIEVTVAGPHNFFRGITEDIGQGGLFIATHQFYPIGTEFNLTLDIEKREILLPVKVVWVRESTFSPVGSEPGMGLQFLEITPEQRSVIEDFIKKKEPLFFDADT
ncbi:MAG TPA: TIGR02266 family protein [bacterium]|nr:TIGR02266 family protein [bacterium]